MYIDAHIFTARYPGFKIIEVLNPGSWGVGRAYKYDRVHSIDCNTLIAQLRNCLNTVWGPRSGIISHL